MKQQNRHFLEVVPQYPLPVPIYEKEDYFAWPVKMMKEKGFNVEIVTKRHGGQKSLEEINGVVVKRFGNIFSLFFYLFQQKNSLVYAQGKIFPAFVGLFCKKSVYNPHASFGQILPKYLGNPLLRFMTRFLFGRFNKVITITPYETKIYKRFGFKKNYRHIYNVIDYRFFNKIRETVEFRKTYKIDKKEQLILFVGNIHGNVKNIDVLYRAFKLVQKKIKNVRLGIIGKEIDLEKQPLFLKELKNDFRVTLTGWLPAEEIAQALAIASVFVNTSKNEGHSLAVAEAASAGVPLCLSKIGTFTSVYKEAALYHNPFDYKKLVENILFYLKNRGVVLRNKKVNQSLIKNACGIKKSRERLFRLLTTDEHQK